MPITLATLSSCCRRCIGAGGLLLSLMPGVLLAAAAPAELKRSDTLDMRRTGKVAEDERAVLRIEWRAGMSGVEADRSLQEIMAKLRQMEATVPVVGHALRSLPAQKRAPASISAPVAPDGDAEGGADWRLMAANITALILVAIWWFSRRKAQAEAAAVEARLMARSRVEPAAIATAPMPRFIDVEPSPASPTPPTPPDPPAPTATATEFSVPEPFPEDFSSASTAAASHAVPSAPPPAEAGEEASAPEPSPTVDFVLEEAAPATIAAKTPGARNKPLPLVTPETVSASLKKNVEPTLQLAEIMLSMGLEQGAAQSLVEYTEANPKRRHPPHAQAAGHLPQARVASGVPGNRREAAQELQHSGRGLVHGCKCETAILEGFSRVSQHVQSVWNQPEECIDYLRHLIEDNRDGARAGFPQSGGRGNPAAGGNPQGNVGRRSGPGVSAPPAARWRQRCWRRCRPASRSVPIAEAHEGRLAACLGRWFRTCATRRCSSSRRRRWLPTNRTGRPACSTPSPSRRSTRLRVSRVFARCAISCGN
jgi:hypothetical protein